MEYSFCGLTMSIIVLSVTKRPHSCNKWLVSASLRSADIFFSYTIRLYSIIPLIMGIYQIRGQKICVNVVLKNAFCKGLQPFLNMFIAKDNLHLYKAVEE